MGSAVRGRGWATDRGCRVTGVVGTPIDEAGAGGQHGSGSEPVVVALVVRVVLAALSAAAGIIHLAMVPSHWSESVLEGLGFAATGWFQLALAVGLLFRPSGLLLRIGIVANVAFVGVWAISRTWGLPLGEHAGHPHDAGFIDLACVGMELAFVASAVYALWHPGFGRHWNRARLAVCAIVPISVIALATAALASPSARDHASESHGSHGHAHEVAASVAGHDDTAHHAGATHADGTAHATLVADKKSGWTALGENGHQHGDGVVELDKATQAALSVQLAQTSRLVEKYPTVASAEAAGYRRQGRFNPGLGTHYGGGSDGVITGVSGEAMVPTLIYDGADPDSPIAGFMYYAPGSVEQVPEGFIGPNDHWHEHTSLCIVMKDGIVTTPLKDPTKPRCDEIRGMWIQRSGYMVHVWTVPGYESPDGVFSGLNRKLTCPDGTYYKDAEGSSTSTCKGV